MTCAYAVRGALQKFSGVEKVDVSLNQGLAIVILKPGSTVHISDMWETVRKNGFSPKTTRVVFRGEVSSGGKTELKLTGTNEVYELVADPKAPNALDAIRREAGKTVTVEGALEPAKDLKVRVPLAVSGVKSTP